MADKKIGGLVYVRVDGEQMWCKGNVEYDEGGPIAEDVVGTDGVHGYSEKPAPAACKVTISVVGTLDTAKLKRKRNATINAALPNGRTFTMANAWQVGEMKVNANTGETEIEFHGATASVK